MFKQKQLNPDYYHGKDFVHEGTLLILNQKIAWKKISSYTRRNIKRAQRLIDLEIKRVKGTKEEIIKFRTIWHNPKDPYIPNELNHNQLMYFALLNKELVGGLILTPSGNNLYLHCLAGNEIAKKKHITNLLLWNAVENLQNSQYKYIDIGVSFRATLQTYFRHWKTNNYPIIFEPPEIKPSIHILPFENKNIGIYSNGNFFKENQLFSKYFGNNFTIFPSDIYCIKALIKHLRIKKSENITIFTSLNNSSFDTNPSIQSAITDQCQCNFKINSKTKAILLIHEYGYPHEQTKMIKESCQRLKIPLIEYCSSLSLGNFGDYVIYSLPRIMPVQYGGVLKGINITDEQNWNEYKYLDFYKKEIILKQLIKFLPKSNFYNKRQLQNFKYLANLFNQDGYELFMHPGKEVFPNLLFIKTENLKFLQQRYSSFGVETIICPTEKIFGIPVHFNLDRNQLKYIYAVFRGSLNLYSSYKRAVHGNINNK